MGRARADPTRSHMAQPDRAAAAAQPEPGYLFYIHLEPNARLARSRSIPTTTLGLGRPRPPAARRSIPAGWLPRLPALPLPYAATRFARKASRKARKAREAHSP